MTSVADIENRTDAGCSCGVTMPVNPYLAVNYHFGMLLGEEDFRIEQGYHRGKGRLHNAWLHGAGVVWGLGVDLAADVGEVKVHPGLALDGAGREMHLDGDACVSLSAWFEAHRKIADSSGRLEPFWTSDDSGRAVTFDAHVTLCFRDCLTRPVPALLEPCDASGVDTAFSRLFETAELRLCPGPAPPPPPLFPHRVRLLLGLDAPNEDEGTVVADDQAVLDALRELNRLPDAERGPAWLDLFRRLVAGDTAGRAPATTADGLETTLFPALENVPLVLAELHGIGLTWDGALWAVTGGTVDLEHRLTLLPTSVLQELIGACLAHLAPPSEDPAGPHIDPGSVTLTGTALAGLTLEMRLDAELQPASVVDAAFAVAEFDPATGWQDLAVSGLTYTPGVAGATDPRPAISFSVAGATVGRLLRLIVRGAGERPLLGQNDLPLAGALSDSPAPGPVGRDFVYQKKVES